MTKYILRKPLIPLIFFFLIVFEVIFMGCLKRGIERDLQAVDDMYNNAVITFSALPESLGELNLRPHFADNLEKMDEFDRICSYMSCPYTLRAPIEAVNISWMYGTNDVAWFAANNGLEISTDGTDLEEIYGSWNEHVPKIPCIVHEQLLTATGLSIGDDFVAASYGFTEGDSPKSPDLNMHIVGTFSESDKAIEDYSIIVPQRIFLEPPEILFNSKLLLDCCSFRQYEVTIKKEYNRNVDEIEDKIMNYFERAGVLVHNDSRVVKKAVHPVEQRLKIQKALEKPLEIALSVAVALLAVLMAIGTQNDIFLFLLFGESKAKTFLKTMLSLGTVIVVSALAAVLGSVIVLGFERLGRTALYAGADVLLCLVACAVPVLVFCNRNMIIFYQTKETN